MKSGSISSMENDDDDVRDDCKPPALPLAMKCDDPIIDTYNAWQREIIAPALPQENRPAFSHRHSLLFEDLNENGTTTPTNGNSSGFGKNQIPSPLKMPYDDILKTDDAEEGCVDGKGLPTTSSLFPPSVTLPNLDVRQHRHATATSACAIKTNHIYHLFKQTTNNYAGGIAFDRSSAIKETHPFASMTTATSLSPYRSNGTSAEANATYDSPRSMMEGQPTIITSPTPLAPKSLGDNQSPLLSGSPFQSEITWSATEKHIFSYRDQFQHHTRDSSSKMNNYQSVGHALLRCPFNGAIKAARVNYTKTPAPSPAMESKKTIHSPATATVESSEEESGGRSKKRKGAWGMKFELLKKYKNEHNGSCDVPQKDPLGAWVNKQRMEYKVHLAGARRSSMTEERRRLLESIGFKWAELKGQASWERRFNELVAYKNETGSCEFPTKSKDNSALGRWVTTQRSAKKNGDIDKDNERRLNEIGFTWDLHHKQPKY